MDVIRELEHLNKLAKEDPNRRFNRLTRLLRQMEFLALAKERIASNKGANTPGVDGRVVNDIDDDELARLSRELAAGAYRPRPVQRRYIPKRDGKLRPLGLPTSRDKVVQAGIALILEALYEPLFRPCSHGFRPGRSPITALRHVSSAYRAGATWIVEGDIADCFGSIPCGVILSCLRKRIRDEHFIDLVRQMVQAGVMEDGTYTPTYSGVPQGGVASPILANVVLHELDCWMEREWQANPPSETTQQRNARSNPEYMRQHHRIVDIRRYLDGKCPMPRHTDAETLRCELRKRLRLRRLQPRCLPRRAIYYTRFADDFVVVLCNTSKQEAQQLKAALAAWLESNLGLTLGQEKTLITHWRKQLRFLGYHLQGRANRNGSKWLHLNVPKAAVREVVDKLQRATAYPQAPPYDVFTNVNAVARGWINFYRYAHNVSVIGGKLSLVTYWLTVHYLAKRQRCSVAKIMRKQYGRDPSTGCQALYIYVPGKEPTPQSRYFLWHKKPPRLTFSTTRAAIVQDAQAYIDVGWAKGRSRQKRLETKAAAGNACQQCGTLDGTLMMHHPQRLSNVRRVKKGSAPVAKSGMEQRTRLLCLACHLAHHHGDTRR